jgi:hypothetical protein
MSGPFVCGMRKFDKHKMFASDRPSNNALHQENQKSLNDLIKQREQQDNGTYTPIIVPMTVRPSTASESTIVYTPWKTPST